MAFGPEVGSVSVRVMPDTRKFRSEAARQLRTLNKTLDDVVKVKINAREVRDFFDKAMPKEVPAPKVELPRLDAFQRRMRAQLNAAVENIEARIPVTVKGEKLRQELAAKVKEAEDAISAKISAEVELAAGQRAKMLGLVAQLTAIARAKRIKIPVEVDTDRGRLRTALAALTSRIGRTASKAANHVANGISGIADGARAAASSLGKMTHAAWIGAAVLALAAPAVSLAAGALVALPGALAGIAAPMGVVALGMDGIKKAAERAKPALDQLKASLAGVFEKGMTGAFQTVNDRLLPQLTDSMTTTATALSEAFTGIVDTLSADETLGELQKLFQNVGVGIRKAIPGLEDFTFGLTDLIGTFSQRFPDMGDAFSKMGADFKSWIAEVTASGQLDSALDTMRGVLGELGGMLKDIGKWGFETLADPKFGESLKGFAADLRSLTNDALPLLKSGFEDVATIVSGIRSTVDAIKGAAGWIEKITGAKPPEFDPADQKKLWGALNDFGINDNAPIIQWLGLQRGGKLATQAGEAAKESAANISKEMQLGLQNTKTQIEESLQVGGGKTPGGVGDVVGGQVDTAISAATTKLAQFQTSFAGMVDTALQPLRELSPKISEVFGGAAAAVATSFGPVVAITKNAIDQLAVTVAFGLQKLPTIVSSAFQGLAGAAAGAFAPVVAMVITGSQQILTAVSSNLVQLPAIANQAFSAMTASIQGQMALSVAAVAQGCGQMVATAGSFAGAMFASGAAIGSSFAAGIRSMIGVVGAAANALMDAARPKFPNSPAEEGPFSGSGWVDRSGVAVGDAFAEGMLSTTKKVGDAATTMTKAAADAITDAQDNIVEKTKNLEESLAAAAQGSIKLGGLSLGIKTGGLTDQLNELKVQQDRLDLQRAQLQLDKRMAADAGVKAAIDARLEELDVTRKQIDAQKEQIDTSSKYGQQQQQIADSIDQAFNSMSAIPKDFAQATMGQFMTDMGMGGGILGAAMDYGMAFGNTTIFNVSGIGEALIAKDRLASQQAAGIVSR